MQCQLLVPGNLPCEDELAIQVEISLSGPSRGVDARFVIVLRERRGGRSEGERNIDCNNEAISIACKLTHILTMAMVTSSENCSLTRWLRPGVKGASHM